ncbi:MAG TPA: hemerythrin domain-containing protein [Candidatus Desulfobacillus sp.]|nr:hemerythrin domain-containing protein [Candidatus Desulfobacillus sp.]
MAKLGETMEKHHKKCDEDFAAAEEAAHKGDWDACAKAYTKFRDEVLAHFSVEEDILFPPLEERSGITSGGPPQMMREEHEQMRPLLQQMDNALEQKNAGNFTATGETLLVMMQQHNMKEENILYPMIDHHLGDDRDITARAEAGLNG